MNRIERNIEAAAAKKYDLIIVGAGIYGVALAWSASRLGLHTLLVERDDFGGATTFNHLRTVHGGLRYLQSMDIPRFFESVNERRWFMKMFPGLVRPLPCLMPLYGNGPYRPSVFRIALGLNDLLSRKRNMDVPAEQQLGRAYVVSAAEVVRRFPFVDQKNLKGGAVWYDGGMPDPQLVLMALLGRACEQGVTALNYLQGERLLVTDNTVCGLCCKDSETGAEYDFHSDIVINAAGPWCREFAASFDRDNEELFRYSIAWNVLFNRPALSDHSLAIKAKRPGSRMYFVHGFNGRIMGGTIHAPLSGVCDNPMPAATEVAAYIDDLNLAVPALHLTMDDVLQVYAGILPVQRQGTDKLAVREVIYNHGASGGPQGAWSVSGVKFTTARLVAEKVLAQVFPARKEVTQEMKPISCDRGCLYPSCWTPSDAADNWQDNLQRIITSQSVLHFDDLVLRRTNLAESCNFSLEKLGQVISVFQWDKDKREEELARLQRFCQHRHPAI